MLLPKTVWARGTRWTWPQDLPTLKGQQPDNDSNSKNRQRQLVSGRTGKPNFSEKLGVSITNKWRIGGFLFIIRTFGNLELSWRKCGIVEFYWRHFENDFIGELPTRRAEPSPLSGLLDVVREYIHYKTPDETGKCLQRQRQGQSSIKGGPWPLFLAWHHPWQNVLHPLSLAEFQPRCYQVNRIRLYESCLGL